MTREEAKEILPIIKAFSEGKKILAKDKRLSDAKYNWSEVDDCSFNMKQFKYRIKPEPKYRPFKDAEECWQEMLKHNPFGWIHVADDNLYHNIIMLAPEQGCHEAYIRIGNCTVRGLEETFRIATFADGQPFGVKE